MIYDIAVIGLGPAGASFARLIDSTKYKVAAIDRKSLKYPDKHAKPCGGLLSPDAQRALARFDLSIPGHIIASPQIFYVKTIDMDNGLTNNYQRFYLNINRQKFDLWLMSLIPDSVDVFDDSLVTGIREERDSYIVEYRQAGTLQSLTAKHNVCSTGALSVVTQRLLKQDMGRFRLCIQESYAHHGQQPFFSCVFDSLNSDSYSWSLSKDGEFIFGGAYDLKQASKAFERQKNHLEHLGVDLSTVMRREACLVYKPRRLRDIRLGRDRIYLLGEAAGFISPSSYEGISGALNSAFLLSCVFNEDAPCKIKAYHQITLKMRLHYMVKIIKASMLCNKRLRKLIMKSRIKNIDVINRFNEMSIPNQMVNKINVSPERF